ncbi:MAG: hypothetical protein HY905_07085 [Deltaproteobacteria bacterium]|nr:hypothetical protein [Deltaproteobacteria bacterium]
MRKHAAVALAGLVGALLLVPARASAHCDTLDGPVVAAARKALESGDVNLVLLWVQPDDEPAIREAFQRTLTVRALGDAARELADSYFFETLVRIHRAGEGAPYTGLKPAAGDLGPVVPAADQALESGSVDALVDLVTAAVQEGIRQRFAAAMERKNYGPGDVAAGREYIEAYVPFLHYAEGIYEATERLAEGHGGHAMHESEGSEGHAEGEGHVEGEGHAAEARDEPESRVTPAEPQAAAGQPGLPCVPAAAPIAPEPPVPEAPAGCATTQYAPWAVSGILALAVLALALAVYSRRPGAPAKAGAGKE